MDAISDPFRPLGREQARCHRLRAIDAVLFCRMGPTLLADKCSIQSLAPEELYSVGSVFYLNVPPILIQEIAGDLKKKSKHGPQHEIGVLAKKLNCCVPEASINLHYVFLCEGELLGLPVPQDGQTVIGGGQRITAPDGKTLVFLDEHPDEATLRRWCNGEVTPEDEAFAEKLRSTTKKVNLEAMVQSFQPSLKGLPRLKNLHDVARSVDHHLATTDQFKSLCTAMDCLKLQESKREEAARRWETLRPTSLRAFAPYTFSIYRAIHIFTVGMGCRVIGTRATNQLDLEYLFYLPFCHIFSSGDNFVIEMSRVLMRPGQLFVDADTLKGDMRAIARIRNARSESARSALIDHYAKHPHGRFNNPLWRKALKPWERDRNLSTLPPDVSKRLFEEARQDIAELKRRGLVQ